MIGKESESSRLNFRQWYRLDNFFRRNCFASRFSSGHVECNLHNTAQFSQQSSEKFSLTVLHSQKRVSISDWKKIPQSNPLDTETAGLTTLSTKTLQKLERVLNKTPYWEKFYLFFLKNVFINFLWIRKMQFLLFFQKFSTISPKTFDSNSGSDLKENIFNRRDTRNTHLTALSKKFHKCPQRVLLKLSYLRNINDFLKREFSQLSLWIGEMGFRLPVKSFLPYARKLLIQTRKVNKSYEFLIKGIFLITFFVKLGMQFQNFVKIGSHKSVCSCFILRPWKKLVHFFQKKLLFSQSPSET